MWETELEKIDTQVRNLRKRDSRLLRAYEFGWDEELVKREKAVLDAEMRAFEKKRIQLERSIEASRQCNLDLGEVNKFCELVRQNFAGFTYENKRLALEALQIKVCIDGSDISIEGAIPVPDVSVVPTPSLCIRQSRSPSRCPTQ